MIPPARATPAAVALAATLMWASLLAFQHMRGDFGVLDRFEAVLTDLRFSLRGEREPPGVVTIVAIDDEAARIDGHYPLPRTTLARIVDTVARSGPKAIAVDVLLLDAGTTFGDSQLAIALGRTRAVIAAAAVFADATQIVPSTQEGALDRLPIAERFLLPMDVFANAASTGIVNVATDRSGTPRLFPMLFRTADGVEASLPLAAAAMATGADPAFEDGAIILGDRRVATDIGQTLPLTYYGPRGSIRTISAADVLAGRAPSEAIEGRIVVIGGTVTGGGDVFPSPFDPILPGVEVISTAVTHLVAGDGMVRDRAVRLIDCAVALGLSLLIVGLLAWRGSAIGLAAIATTLALWLTVNMGAFASGYWLSAALPLAAAVPPAILFGATQLWLGRRRAATLAQESGMLARFQPPGLRGLLATHPEFLAEPVRQNAAIVFIDLSGFTGLSETAGPVAMRDLLNGFYEILNTEAAACSGTITSFMGDGAMIVFGLPEPGDDDAHLAVGCCIALAGRTRAWLDSLPPAVRLRIGFKIGAHFGEIVASRLGVGGQEHITATGDTVNVAARLMEIAAANGNDLAVSDVLIHAAGSDASLKRSGRLQGPVETHVRGRTGALSTWLWTSDGREIEPSR